MIANYLIGHPLAMIPTKVIEISDFLEKRSQGVKVQLDEPSVKEDAMFYVNNGIATINIFGSISKRMNALQRSSGGVSCDMLRDNLIALVKDEDVKGIFLNIDSPGGSVHGIKDISDIIADCEKPVVAFSDGLMASAAYWIGSAADKVIVSETSTVGSIGVVTVHTDFSKSDEKDGIKRTVLTAGKFKALGNPNEPLNEDSRAEIQDKLDQFYSIFVESIAKNRIKDVESILSVSEGKTFVGANAPDELVDLTGSMEVAYNHLVNLIIEGENMTIEEMKNTDEFKAEVDKSAEIKAGSAIADAVNAERKRCIDIMSIEGGHQDLKLNAIMNGESVDSLYKDLYKAEIKIKSNEQGRLSKITEPVDVNPDPPANKISNPVRGSDFLKLTSEYESKGFSKAKAMKAARQENPQAHAAYIEENN